MLDDSQWGYQPAIMGVLKYEHCSASTALNDFETIWKLPVLKCNMLKPTQIVVICCKETGFDDWLNRSWLNLSNIYIICSRIHIFHSSMSNGSPWHAKPPPHRSQKLMKIAYRGQWEAAKPNKEHKHIFNQISRSIVSCKLIGRIHAGLRGEFLPVLGECSWRTYI